jgi:hypothetical protein
MKTVAAAVITLASLVTGVTSVTGTSAPAASAAPLPAPVHYGTLRVSGTPRDGATVTATGLSWHVPRLPRGMSLLSFQVAYSWQSCDAAGQHCRAGADTTAAPFAARRYVPGQADAGRRLRVTETAAEVIETKRVPFTFQVIRRAVTALAATPVRAYPRHKAPATAFVNGTPERHTASTTENFQVSALHANAADGPVTQSYRIDAGAWRPMPKNRVFSTGTLAPGPHRVAVRTASRAGATLISYAWQVDPMTAPLPCQGDCWSPPHLDKTGHPMRWDWQIGRTTPLQRTGRNAVDIYDIDGFLTTRAQVTAIKTGWQAATLPHPKAVCYLDLAWEDYRPDGTPGTAFPAAALGNIYFGFPEERWVDLRQLDALKPMLAERIGMCERKGFDAVELDDIDSFDPPSTTGFHLTPGDLQNFLAYAFNLIHADGMTGLWKNSPLLSWWGRQYADGAVVEECYSSQQCFASQFKGSRPYGITCTALSGPTPCGWDDFTAAGQWVGEAEYAEDGYVCNPGQVCQGPHSFGAYCRAVYAVPHGFAAVKFDVDLDGALFHPCVLRDSQDGVGRTG